ncbi:MAG: nucleotidyltransferase family protein [Actinomycetota bacterium]
MIVAVVLAAGTSERLGRPKQLLELEGKPLLQHAVDRAALHFDRVVVVLGHEAAAIEAVIVLPPNARTVLNESFAEGHHGSVRVGFAAATAEGNDVALLLGDQPYVDDDLIARTFERFRSSVSEVVRPRHGGAPGHPVLVRADTAARLASGDDDQLGPSLRGPQVEWIDGGPDAPADVDTWEAYEDLKHKGRTHG